MARPPTRRVPASAAEASYPAAAFQIPAPTRAAAEATPAGMPVLLDVEVALLPARSVVARETAHDGILLPLEDLVRMVGGHWQRDGNDVVIRTGPEEVRITVGDGKVSRHGRDVSRQHPGTVRWIEGAAHVDAATLSQLLAVRAYVDAYRAVLVIREADHLPAVARQLRERRRHAGRDDPERRFDMIIEPASRLSGFVADYRILGTSGAAGEAMSYDVTVGTGFGRGSGIVGISGMVGDDPRIEGRWTMTWPRSRVLTTLALGDAAVGEAFPRLMRGVTLSNAPVRRPTTLGTLDIGGELPLGWNVEALRSQHVIAHDSVANTGQWSLGVPVRYGDNNVRVLAYGPHGDRREFQRHVRVSGNQLQPKRFEYTLAAGACRVAAQCGATAGLALRYGLGVRWTAFGGLDHWWRDSSFEAVPHVGMSGMPWNTVNIEAAVYPGAGYRGSLWLQPIRSIQLAASVDTRRATGVPSFGSQRSRWNMHARLDATPRLAVEGSVNHLAHGVGQMTWGTGAVVLRGSGLRVRSEVIATRSTSIGQTPPLQVGVQATAHATRLWGGHVPAWVTGLAYIGGDGRAQRLGASANYAFTRRVEAQVSYDWIRSTTGRLRMSLSTRLPALRSVSTGTAIPRSGRAWGTQMFAGSLTWDWTAQRLVAQPDPGTERGVVGGMVFLDTDADGHYDAGEPGLEGVLLRIGHQRVRTDEAGRFALGNLRTWEELAVVVDTMSFAMPWWLPTHGSISVTPLPNQVQHVAVPVVASGVIEGRIATVGFDGGWRASIPRLALVDRTSGEARPVDVFHDMGFYIAGVPPGHYELCVDAQYLHAMNGTSDAVPVTITGGSHASDPAESAPDIVRDINIVIANNAESVTGAPPSGRAPSRHPPSPSPGG